MIQMRPINQSINGQCFGSIFTESGSWYFAESESGASLLLDTNPEQDLLWKNLRKKFIIGIFFDHLSTMSSKTPYKGRSDSSNINFLNFSYFESQFRLAWIRNPDPLTQLNQDPKHCQWIIIFNSRRFSHLHFSLKTLPLCLVWECDLFDQLLLRVDVHF